MAWIETKRHWLPYRGFSVATREGGVDRNPGSIGADGKLHSVATREGGVDRNREKPGIRVNIVQSPPARVAWIETSGAGVLLPGALGRHPRGWRG